MRQLNLLACAIPVVIAGIGCVQHEPLPGRVADRPVELEGVASVQFSEDVFQAPPGQIRVSTTTRSTLEARRRPATRGEDFDNASRPLLYIGSDDDWDYYYLADHAFGVFWRVCRADNEQDARMAPTGDSLGWREVGSASRPISNPATTRP